MFDFVSSIEMHNLLDITLIIRTLYRYLHKHTSSAVQDKYFHQEHMNT